MPSPSKWVAFIQDPHLLRTLLNTFRNPALARKYYSRSRLQKPFTTARMLLDLPETCPGVQTQGAQEHRHRCAHAGEHAQKRTKVCRRGGPS